MRLARQRRENVTGRVTIAGAGMAGLVAAARARELGAAPVVLEKGGRPGGSMLLSSGVVWRHHSFEDFRTECPAGDPALQRRLVEELDDALDWLESLGVEPTIRETGNPLTVGRRYDTRALTDALVRAAGDVRLEEPFRDARVLATGGFGARLARERGLLLRANEWSEGDGLDYGIARGASTTAGMDEYYGRALPCDVEQAEYVSAAQLYARHALVLDDEGVDLGPAAWHESNLVQRLPGGRAWYVVDARALRQPVRERTVADLVEAARASGGDVRPADELPFVLPESPKLVEPPFVAVRVYAAVTHTIGGLRIDERARVLDGETDGPSRGCWQPAPTQAGSSPAVTGAAWPPRSSSAASPPRPPSRKSPFRACPGTVPGHVRNRQVVSETSLTPARAALDDLSAPDMSGPGPHMSHRDVAGYASCVYAQRRRSPGRGEGPSLLTRSVARPPRLSRRPPAARRRAAAASSRPGTRQRARSPRFRGCRSVRHGGDSKGLPSRRGGRRGSPCRRPLPARPRSGR